MAGFLHATLKKITTLFKTDLVKVFSFTSLSTLVKMVTGFVSMKVIAVIIGPTGVALLGQLQNFSSIIQTVSSGGISNGVTKYIAEHKDDESRVKTLLSTALRISVICSLVCGLLMIVFNQSLGTLILKSSDYDYVFIIFGITILFYALNNLLISILNGYKDFKRYVLVNMAGSVFGLLFTIVFVLTLGIHGALISAVTYQSVVLIVTLLMIRKLPWVTISHFKETINKAAASNYVKYAMMTLVTAATLPVAQLILRSHVIAALSPEEAGWWEAMNRLSSMYLMVITSSLGVYYLPKLSEIKSEKALRTEIFSAYKVIVPLLIGAFIVIYLARYILIRLLFSQDFTPMHVFFSWQLLGDFFKVTSWLLSFVMVAKAMTKQFIVTEIVFAALFVGLSFVFMHLNGVIGITQAHLVNYILYLGCMLVVFRKMLFSKQPD
jgi:PST family polysaccharide transporter